MKHCAVLYNWIHLGFNSEFLLFFTVRVGEKALEDLDLISILQSVDKSIFSLFIHNY